jgi:hypothetical protein
MGVLTDIKNLLTAILAKIIAAPATEAKQDTMAGLVGEVQASPTANTVLARLKALLTDIVIKDTKVVKTSATLATAQTIEAANPANEENLTNGLDIDVSIHSVVRVGGAITFGADSAANAVVAIYGKMNTADSYFTTALATKTVTLSAGNAVEFLMDALDIKGFTHLKITAKNFDTTPGVTHDVAITARAILN